MRHVLYIAGAQGISPYSNLSKKIVGSELSDIYMTIPQPNDLYNPQIGSRCVFLCVQCHGCKPSGLLFWGEI